MMNVSMLIVCGILVLLLLLLLLFLWLRFRSRKEKGRYTAPKGEKLHIRLESGNLEKTALEVLEGLGGRDNVVSLSSEGSRLKAEIRQYSAVNEAKLREAGLGAVIRPSKTMVHIIVGELAGALTEALGACLSKARIES